MRQTAGLEPGSSLAWAAILLATLLIPLLLLLVDGSRLLDVRGRLQTAADAACEDAAWLAGDRSIYLESGQSLFGDLQVAHAQAQNTFAATLGEQTRMGFNSSLSINFDEANRQVLCSATASVGILFNVPGNSPGVTIPAYASAAIRIR